MPSSPKYSLPEIERRWLVDPARIPNLDAVKYRTIEDKYLDGGKLRLRVIRADGLETLFKLGKKYVSEGAQYQQIVTIYLSEDEYRALNVLPGKVSRKRRYSVGGGSVDIHDSPHPRPVICELEFETVEEAAAFTPPEFVTGEITGDAAYSGFEFAV